MEVDKQSDEKSDIKAHWMAAHACLNNDFKEDEKYHNLFLKSLRMGLQCRSLASYQNFPSVL